jgi:hypothetical protein
VLGLRTWDLFLNLGLAELEGGDIDAATHSLRMAVESGPSSLNPFEHKLITGRRIKKS